MKTSWERGDTVTFTAQRPCQLRGRHYKQDDEVIIVLARDWEQEEGVGEGGPWGWGGYTSRFLKSLGRVEI